MDGFLVAFVIALVAELGDKSQIMAFTFALRYRILPVLIGITLATSVIHLVAVAAGYGLGASIPHGWIALAASMIFIGFALWTLRGDDTSGDSTDLRIRAAGSVIVSVAVTFFLAEIGDKTMLASVTLAAQYDLVAVWIGSTSGMVVADALAIGIARTLGGRIPPTAVRIASGAMFGVVGVWQFVDTAPEVLGDAPIAAPVAYTVVGLGAAAVVLACSTVAVRSLRRPRPDRPPVPGAASGRS